jgi:hypothetical protein
MQYLTRRAASSILCLIVTLFGASAHATPEETTDRVLQTLDSSGPFVFSLQGSGNTTDVWWSGSDFIVVINGEVAIDTVTSIDGAGRLCAACSFNESNVPSLSIAIDYPLGAPWMVFTVSREGTGSVQISPDNALRVCAMVKCKCVGPGSTTVLEACSDANCDNLDVCKKTQDSETAWCQWKYSATYCDLIPELPIIVDDEIDP